VHLQRPVRHRIEPELLALREIVRGDEMVHFVVAGHPVSQAVQARDDGEDQQDHRQQVFQV
jgi:hypothetical protein